MIRLHVISLGLVVLSFLAGCQKEEAGQTSKPPMVSNTTDGEANSAHHGPATDLGSTTVDGWTVRATRSEIKAGESDIGVDVWITGGTAKISAVRCWIGTEDAAGSIKSLVNVESQSDPDHRHAHVEMPSALPPEKEVKLWVEWEDDSGAKHLTSFDLKSA